ncbi:hypothetical protein AHF37_05025 [Paragonimus kellicotti]|nr:hypothetical protein AHF37_05025 [Paragonimus kellicotti]
MCADVCTKIDRTVEHKFDWIYASVKASQNVPQSNISDYNISSLEDLINQLKLVKSPGTYLVTCQLHHFLWTYVPPILFLLGSFGNILAFLVLRHPSTRYVSAFVYLAARSVVDEIVLIVGLFRRWTDYLIGVKLENTSSFLCKLAQFAGTSSSLLSVWLTVMLTAERALVVSLPLHGNRMMTFSRVRRIILLLSFLCVLVSIHFFFTVDLIKENVSSDATGSCQANVLSNLSTDVNELHNQSAVEKGTTSECPDYCSFGNDFAFLRWLWTSIDATIYCYLPFILIFGCNIVIVRYVYVAQKRQYSIRVHSDRKKLNTLVSDNSNSIRQLTIMLLVISFAFLVTTVSIVVVKLLNQVLDLEHYGDIRSRSAFQLADTVAELLMYVNHAMNFYLFCATGKRFRSRLLFLISKCKRQGFRAVCYQRNAMSTTYPLRCSQNCSNQPHHVSFGSKCVEDAKSITGCSVRLNPIPNKLCSLEKPLILHSTWFHSAGRTQSTSSQSGRLAEMEEQRGKHVSAAELQGGPHCPLLTRNNEHIKTDLTRKNVKVNGRRNITDRPTSNRSSYAQWHSAPEPLHNQDIECGLQG